MNWSPSTAKALAPIAAILGIGYPFLVYFTLERIPAGALVLAAAALTLLRLGAARGHAVGTAMTAPLLAVMAATLVMGAASPQTAALFYPVAMSLGFAGAFAASLLRPPSLIELFARPFEPDPGPQAQAYMRKASLAWAIYLCVNAAISAATALWAEPWLWVLYNGALSYGLTGLMFLGEWLVRRRIRNRHAAS